LTLSFRSLVDFSVCCSYMSHWFIFKKCLFFYWQIKIICIISPPYPWVSASMDSTNLRLKIFLKCVHAESVQFFSYYCNNYLYKFYIVLSITHNLEMISNEGRMCVVIYKCYTFYVRHFNICGLLYLCWVLEPIPHGYQEMITFMGWTMRFWYMYPL
jgi:hypothetical protein